VNNNYYRFSLNINDKDIIIPVEISFDTEGRDQGVEAYEEEVLQQLINGVDDFEIAKFAAAVVASRCNFGETSGERKNKYRRKDSAIVGRGRLGREWVKNCVGKDGIEMRLNEPKKIRIQEFETRAKDRILKPWW